MTSLKPSEPRYVTQGRRGQELLDQGRIPEAVEAFEAVLRGLGDEAGYGRGVVLERLGRALLLAGNHDAALDRLRQALDVAGRLAPTDSVRRLRCTLRSGLGDALRSSGRPDEARRAYLAALEIGRGLRDSRSQGVDQARLGALALAQGDLAEALERYRESLAALRELKEPAVEAVAWHQLGRLFRQLGDSREADRHYQEAARLREAHGDPEAADPTWTELIELHRDSGRLDEAERWCRRAIEGSRGSGPSLRLARRLLTLADLLRGRSDRLAEARHVAERALALAQGLDPTAAEGWNAYGILGEIQPERAALRELARRAPLIVAAAERLGPTPRLGRAVILARLGRCFYVGGRPDLAVAYLREAVHVAEQVVGEDGSVDLLGMLWTELGDVLSGQGSAQQATLAFASSLRLAERSRDLEGMARNRKRLGQVEPAAAADAAAEPVSPEITGPAEVTVLEDTVTDYAFDPNLLLDGPRTRKLVRLTDDIPAVPEQIPPLLVPCTRAWLDPEGRIRFAPPADEPSVRTGGGCTVMRRTSRDVAVTGGAEIWHLLGAMDGRSPWGEILAGMPEAYRAHATLVLGALAAAGVVDVSGRPVGRFIHHATKKGVIPAGGLEGDEILRLATDGGTRSRHELPRIPLATSIPEPLRPLHALTRSRRSTRDYRGGALSREELEALLVTACGVTGSMRWAGGELKLRAYPSSGALYSVGVYPVVFRVERLEPAVHRFDAEGPALEVLGPLDPARFVQAALPMEREMVAGIAAMICLTGVFPRHERKYGEGGYRMLVAEAGHVSHNLVLAATALGLSARPFGGVFDSLINEALGLDEAQEQFLLAVVVGR
jgi:SagB-type dehydrogenase family enzyme